MYLITSPLKTKKYRAVFSDGSHTDFGAVGYTDFILSGGSKEGLERRKRYLNRHKNNENWNNPRSAGALSRWILWGQSSSIADNLRDFKLRFAGRV
jgi:hypothetical protein